MHRGISLRSIVSVLTLYLFVFVVLTGIVLYIVPPTRVANELQWTLAGISKVEYIRMHTILSFSFIISSGMHIWYNRSALWRYLCVGNRGLVGGNIESILAIVCLLLVLLVSYFNLSPVDKIMSWGTVMKESWGGPGGGQGLHQGRNHILLPKGEKENAR